MVLRTAFPNPSHSPPVIQKSWSSSLHYLVPWPRVPTRHRSPSAVLAQSSEVQREEWRYRLWRWGFLGASLVAVTGYLLYATRNITIVLKGGNIPERLPSPPSPPPEMIPEAEERDEEEEAAENV